MLVNDPGDFVRMPGKVRGKLRGDKQVDGAAIALAQVQQPPRGRMRENLALRIPLEGYADELRVQAVSLELSDELSDVVLGTAADERHLRFTDEDRAQDRA